MVGVFLDCSAAYIPAAQMQIVTWTVWWWWPVVVVVVVVVAFQQ